MNIITFFHRFLGPQPPPTAEPSPLTAFPIEQRYWGETIDHFLRWNRYARRWDAPAPLQVDSLALQLLDGGAHVAAWYADDTWVWTVWVTLGVAQDTSIERIHEFLATYHHWARNYPGHELPKLALTSPQGERTLAMHELLAFALPDSVKGLSDHFSRAILDQRLAVFATLCCPSGLPRGEALRALLDIDSPTGMEAPDDWTSAWLASRTYNRWERSGVLYGFTHHSGVILHTSSTWLPNLCRPRESAAAPPSEGCYFDLALLSFSEAALEILARTSSGDASSTRQTRAADTVRMTLRRLREAFSTPIDQGRDLLRLWRCVALADLGVD
jgi:hypothetical protein